MSNKKITAAQGQVRKPGVRSIKGSDKPTGKSEKMFERFHWSQRIAHALLLTSFTLLGVTGLPQKFSQAGWAQFMIQIFGGIESTRLIHHVSAVVLMLLAIYHILDLGYKLFVLRTSLTMLPTFKDIKDALQAFAHNIGLKWKRPQMGRYTFEEKAEYWALIWGTVIMGITGFMMWNPIFTAKLFPGMVIPAAKAAHGGEALLAVLAIFVWHMYGVHIRRFNKAMWTGKLTEDEMVHEHPLELADIKAGLATRRVDPKILQKRKRIYYPAASVLAGVMLFAVFGFVSGEKTAITTVLPVPSQVVVYSPQTPTPIMTLSPEQSSGSAAGGALTWDGSIGPMLASKCELCHGPAMATNGLSFATYTAAMTGAQDGPVILPGDAENSKIVQVQLAGGHPGQLTQSELDTLIDWINAGASEK